MALDMMGYWQQQTELWVEPINLGRRVSPDHLLRKINKVLDLGFVRREVAGFLWEQWARVDRPGDHHQVDAPALSG
jgi:hypothetical protein